MASGLSLGSRALVVPRFAVYCLRRFFRDGGPRLAASLSYSTLLAVVPILAIALALLSFVPLFDDVYVEMLEAIFANFLPEAGLEISEQIVVFVDNARRVTGIGFLALIATAYLMLSAVTTAFNAIWRISSARPILRRLLLQWGALTLWPLLVAGSISLSNFQVPAFPWMSLEEIRQSHDFAWVLPFLMMVLAFGFLYAVMPARHVSPLHALVGALVAALLFELLRKLFGFYVREFRSYELVYGALAVVPLFLFWMYLSWVVVLLGAEITAALPEWLLRRRLGEIVDTPGSRLALGLTILARLEGSHRANRGVRERALQRGLPSDAGHFQETLGALRRAGYVRRRGGGWVLSHDLTQVPLDRLLRDLGLTWEPGSAWPEEIERAVTRLFPQRDQALGLSVKDILQNTED